MGDGKLYVLGFSNGFVTTKPVSVLQSLFAQLVKVQKLPVFIARTTSNQSIPSKRRKSNLEKRT